MVPAWPEVPFAEHAAAHDGTGPFAPSGTNNLCPGTNELTRRPAGIEWLLKGVWRRQNSPVVGAALWVVRLKRECRVVNFSKREVIFLAAAVAAICLLAWVAIFAG